MGLDMDGVMEKIFTDEQVTNATGLNHDNLRRLITWGAVKPIQSGGGRGRVRLWTARQALRVSVTSQFVEAGFSLRMAHTLSYCIPLDELITSFDPDAHTAPSQKSKKPQPPTALEAALLDDEEKALIKASKFGGQVLIVDGKYVYSDVFKKDFFIWAVINFRLQRVYPLISPFLSYRSALKSGRHKVEKSTDAANINVSSLLVHPRFRSRTAHDFQGEDFVEKLLGVGGKDLIYPMNYVVSLDRLVSKKFLVINIAVGLTVCLRKLLGLDVIYSPHISAKYAK